MTIIRQRRWAIEVPPIKATYYRHGDFFGNVGGDTTPGDQRVSYMPITLPPCTIDRICTHVSVLGSAGAVVRLGLYATAADGRPGALLVDGGTVAATTTGVKEVTVSVAHGGGRVWMAAVPQGAPGTPVQFRAYALSPSSGVLMTDTSGNATNANWLGYREDGVAGALPGTASPAAIYEGVPRIYVRCS